MLNNVKKEVKYAHIKNYMIDKTLVEHAKELRGESNNSGALGKWPLK